MPSESDLATEQQQHSQGELADGWAAALGFFGKTVMRSLQMKGQNIHWRRTLGVIISDFHPSSIFSREGGVFVLIEQRAEVSRQQRMLSTYKVNFIVMRAQGAKGYFSSQKIPAFAPFFVCYWHP